MREIHLDIETFSVEDLKKVGLYKYAAPCEILMVAYGPNKYKLDFFDFSMDDFPEDLISDLQNPYVIKYAHNAAFEIACLSAALGIELDPAQWRCSMAVCAMAALPMGLDEVSLVLGLDEQKDKEGKALIALFCKPCKPTKANGYRTRNLPVHFPEKWARFCEYCKQDVRTEIAVMDELKFIKVPALERQIWNLDQLINTRGVKVDLQIVRNAIEAGQNYKDKLLKEAQEITGLSNPNSVKALKKWLEEEVDEEIANLQKKELPKLIARFDSLTVKRVLHIREEISKTSITKYATMLRAVLRDGRIRGLFQYSGAGRTLRFAGRLVQLQNLVKGKYKYNKETDFDDLGLARTLLKNNEIEMLELLYGSIPNVLSQLIRTAIVPAKGKRFIVSDFAAIEARVLAWLSGEKWRLKSFKDGIDIYKASAARILGKPVEDITKEERDKIGKVSELAFGYAGGFNAAVKMGALEAGLQEREIQPLVNAWRAASPAIVSYWYEVDRAAKRCINTGEVVTISHGITFSMRKGYLVIGLPSGHNLYYYGAKLIPGERGVQIEYWGVDQTRKRWCKMRTYGGKLVENLCQAIGRDCLVQGMYNLYQAGYDTVLHVHDETANECDFGFGSLEEVNELMITMPAWAKGLPLRAEGFEAAYYKKD